MDQKKTRLDLDNELREVLGSSNVYFSPPESIKLKYPCIVYHRTYIDTKRADNRSYTNMIQYTVTIIDKDPDSGEFKDAQMNPGLSLIEKFINHFPMCKFANSRTVNNLNHDTFYLFY